MRGTCTTLYFSAKHDADLLELYRQVGRKVFVKIMKESVRMLVRPGYKPQCLREVELFPGISIGDGPSSESVSLSLVVSFSAKKDEDVSSLLRMVVPGKLGLFVKNAMRMAVGPYFCLGCLLLGGDNEMNLAYRSRGMFFVQILEENNNAVCTATSHRTNCRSSAKLNCKGRESKPSIKRGVNHHRKRQTLADKKEDCSSAAPNCNSAQMDCKAMPGALATGFAQDKAEREGGAVQNLAEALATPETSREEESSALSEDDILSLLEKM